MRHNSPVGFLDVSNVDAVARVASEIDNQIRQLLNPKFGDGRRRECYVTFATPEYLLGATVLIRSLRLHSVMPIIVLTDRDWTFETKAQDVYFVTVPRLGNSRHSPERVEIRATPTKLWIFGFLSLDRVVYIDADCLVLRSIQDLFDRSGLWVAPDYVEDAQSTRFNSGLIAFDPSPDLRDRIFQGAYKADSYDHGEQGSLNSLLAHEANFLPPDYCVSRHYHLFRGADVNADAVRVVHYIVKKPWEMWYRELPDAALCDLDDRWTEALTYEELLALVAQWRRRQFNLQRSGLVSSGLRSELMKFLGVGRTRYLVIAVLLGVFGVVISSSIVVLASAIAGFFR